MVELGKRGWLEGGATHYKRKWSINYLKTLKDLTVI
jgi:hypothetical protein